MTTLPAGNFSDWLRAMRAALAGGPGMQVACGDCVGCCTSSYFIKVRDDEHDALAHIPPAKLEPSAEEPGTRLMGFDAHGHCPMFRAAGSAGGGCSIYAHRPQTCRTYDCRIFTAAGMEAGPGKTMINERVASWRFEYPTAIDREEHAAVRAAAGFLRQHPVRFPNGRIPSRRSEIAVLAVKSYTVFLGRGTETDGRALADGIVAACRSFDQQGAS